MKHGEKIAPVAAALTGLATLARCLPVGFAAAAVIAGAIGISRRLPLGELAN